MGEPKFQHFPRGILLGAGAVVFITLAAAAAARLTGSSVTDVNTSPAEEVRELRFEDRNDGSVAVLQAADDKTIDILTPGTSGFVRNVMRSMARERKQAGLGSEKPFRLVRWADGRFSIEDPATGRHVDLGAFGSMNTTAFARLMGRESTQ
jgi:putative photosynthetic complex assembly protein